MVDRVTTVDVAIVGGGLAGTSAAIVLGRRGKSVTLIDTHAVCPPEFRAEKLGDAHVALFEDLDLFDIVRPVCTPVDRIDVYRFGRLVAQEQRREYGFGYSDMINALRGALPDTAELVVGRVSEVATSTEQQRITLADGRSIVARLLVIATGLGDTVRRQLGIKRNAERRNLSLSLGFDLAEPAQTYPFETLTAYGYRRADRLAYLTLFPIGTLMRANLFMYRETGDDWTNAFRRTPEKALQALLPEIAEQCRGFALSGRVELRPIDLITVDGERQDGVVLIGDAFQTTCPIPGNGIRRVLTDVERLCLHHVPGWFETPGMAMEKLASFYEDPVKVGMDALATRTSLYARAMVLDNGPLWTARRFRNAVLRRGLYQTSRLLGRSPVTSGLMTVAREAF